jgi:hypothetical protein
MTRFIQKHSPLAERSFPRLMLAVLVAGVLLASVSAAHAKATSEQKCQQRRYAAAAKYSACEQKVTGKVLSGGDFTKFEVALSKCRVTYTGTWAKLEAKASGTGATCDATRFAVSGGTVTDKLTGLQWEQKTDDASVHDKDNLYTWSAGGGGFTAADGTAFTSYLATLNSGGCFAGQCDWRLPTRGELQTILSERYPCITSPCIDQGVFGPTVATHYWSATTHADGSNVAWDVDFNAGHVDFFGKGLDYGVRAVRAGL